MCLSDPLSLIEEASNTVLRETPICLLHLHQGLSSGSLAFNKVQVETVLPTADSAGAYSDVNTLAATAWIDLREEPAVITIPSIDNR